MLAAFESGRTVKQLSKEFEIRCDRVHAILKEERERREFSPESYYPFLRNEEHQVAPAASIWCGDELGAGAIKQK